uniref:Uncharacterized protein n=1 Tax=Romanomermis culicivorax TaxID=13658 RepID=A0A915L2C7_ROMCU
MVLVNVISSITASQAHAPFVEDLISEDDSITASRIARKTEHVPSSSNNIRFNIPDLNVKHNVNGINSTLPAFKVEEKDRNNQWVSIGHPVFLRDENNSIYRFNPESILMRLRLLSDDQKNALKDAAKKFDPKIKEAFIHLIPLQSLSCSAALLVGEKIVDFQGRAHNLNQYEVTVEIPCKENSENRKAFYARMKRPDPINWKCTFIADGKERFVNRIHISAEDVQDAAIDHNLFGPASEVYVTRNQLSLFSQKIRNNLKIEEDYELDEKFDEKLVDRLISIASSSFKYVPIDDALSKLSKFGFSMNERDLAANEIKGYLSDEITHQIQNKKHSSSVQEDKKRMDSKEDENVKRGSAKASFGSVFSTSLNTEHLQKKANRWEKADTSLKDKLDEIYRDDQFHIKFEFDGSKIVPKAIKVALLHKNDFKRDLSVSYKKIVRRDARFKQVIYIPAQYFNEAAHTLKALKEEFKNHKKAVQRTQYATNRLNSTSVALRGKYDKFLNEASNILESKSLLLNSHSIQCKEITNEYIPDNQPIVYDCSTFGDDYFAQKLRTISKVTVTSGGYYFSGHVDQKSVQNAGAVKRHDICLKQLKLNFVYITVSVSVFYSKLPGVHDYLIHSKGKIWASNEKTAIILKANVVASKKVIVINVRNEVVNATELTFNVTLIKVNGINHLVTFTFAH